MPMKPVSLSVVIASWNAKAYLEECLQSLAEDVYDGPMEIVVVDNASSDGSADMVERQFPAVTLIRRLRDFALELDPSVRLTFAWNTLACKRILGVGPASALLPTVVRVRARVARLRGQLQELP